MLSMVRFIHTADWHVGVENYSRIDPQTGLSTRLEDFLNSIDFIVDFALKEKIDFVLFAGDAYKTREPSPTHQRELAKRVLRLTKAGIPFVCLVGNHDTPTSFGKANSLDIYSTLELENVFVIREPQIVKLSSVQILSLPWLPRSDFEQLGKILASLYKEVERDLPLIVCAHATVEGAVFGSERSVSLGRDFVVPKKQLISHPQTSYVALGHIHKRQVIYDNTLPIVYSGSIERVDFGEEREEKSFELVQINGLKATHKPILTPSRKFLTIKVDVAQSETEATEKVLEKIKDTTVAGCIVRLIVNFPPDSISDLRITEIKKALREAFLIASISKNIQKTTRSALEKGVEIEGLSPLELVVKYFESKSFSQERIKTLTEYTKDLMEGS